MHTRTKPPPHLTDASRHILCSKEGAIARPVRGHVSVPFRGAKSETGSKPRLDVPPASIYTSTSNVENGSAGPCVKLELRRRLSLYTVPYVSCWRRALAMCDVHRISRSHTCTRTNTYTHTHTNVFLNVSPSTCHLPSKTTLGFTYLSKYLVPMLKKGYTHTSSHISIHMHTQHPHLKVIKASRPNDCILNKTLVGSLLLERDERDDSIESERAKLWPVFVCVRRM